MIKLTEEQAKDIHQDEGGETGYVVVESPNWEDGGKYDYADIIFAAEADKKTGPYYGLGISRSGSYYTDWHYMYELDCHEMEKKPVTEIRWVTK